MYILRDVECWVKERNGLWKKDRSSISSKAHENSNTMALPLYGFSHTTLSIPISHCIHLSNMFDML
jgi:hypothetical protein